MVARNGLRQAVSDALVAQGYERKDNLLRRRIDSDFSWVVDTGLLDGGPEISPWVGLRHERVEKLVTELLELPDGGFVGTAGSNIGYIMGGEYRIWREPTAPEVVLARIDESRQVLDEYRTLEKLPGVFEIRGAKGPMYHFTLAAIYLLLGDEQRVREWLAEGERTDCRVEGPVCEQFRRARRNVEAKMAAPLA
jgi:hypothetical protein